MCVASHMAKNSNASESATLCYILVFSAMIGMIVNFIVLINTQLIEPRFVFLTLEINFAFGQFSTLAIPLLAAMHEPWPSYVLFILTSILILITITMDLKDQEEFNEEHNETTYSLIQSVIMYNQSYSMHETQGNNIMNKWQIKELERTLRKDSTHEND